MGDACMPAGTKCASNFAAEPAPASMGPSSASAGGNGTALGTREHAEHHQVDVHCLCRGAC
jgi:hypothetical protein